MDDLTCLTRVKRKRSQLFAVDVLFAFAALIFLFVLTASTADYIGNKAAELEKRVKLHETSVNVLNQLLSTPGNPRDWNLLQEFNESTVSSLGIVSEEAILDKDKVEKFFNLTYSNSTYLVLKNLLGVTEPGYEFFAAVYYANRTLAYRTNLLAPEVKQFSILERIALLEGEEVKFAFGVWIE